MRLAHQKAIESHYVKILDAQVERWQRAKELRAFCKELEHRLANPRPTDRDLTPGRQWLSWINDHISQEDPIEHPPAMPEPPELRHADLEPFLNGWSPHGPEAHLNSWQRRW